MLEKFLILLTLQNFLKKFEGSEVLKPNSTLAKKIIKFTNISNDLIETNQLKKKFVNYPKKKIFMY